MSAINLQPHTFEPATLSAGELNFLLDHLTESPNVALHKGVPTGVNPTAIQSVLGELQELHQLHQAHGQLWAGFDAIKDSVLRYLSWQERCREIYRRTGGVQGQRSVLHASLYAWDASGSYFKAGIDADSAEMVRTEILDDGSRKPFGVRLLEPAGHMAPDLGEVAPWTRIGGGIRPKITDALVEKRAKTTGSITCSVCEKAEAFDPRSRQSYSAARARMGRHLSSAKNEVARHRLLHRKAYESPTGKA